MYVRCAAQGAPWSCAAPNIPRKSEELGPLSRGFSPQHCQPPLGRGWGCPRSQRRPLALPVGREPLVRPQVAR